jgi:hypothetical protein
VRFSAEADAMSAAGVFDAEIGITNEAIIKLQCLRKDFWSGRIKQIKFVEYFISTIV